MYKLKPTKIVDSSTPTHKVRHSFKRTGFQHDHTRTHTSTHAHTHTHVHRLAIFVETSRKETSFTCLEDATCTQSARARFGGQLGALLLALSVKPENRTDFSFFLIEK